MENKRSNNLVTLLVVLGSIAAICLAVLVFYKKFYKRRHLKNNDPFDFDDDFFFDDCEGCYDEDCYCGACEDEDDLIGASDSDEELAF